VLQNVLMAKAFVPAMIKKVGAHRRHQHRVRDAELPPIANIHGKETVSGRTSIPRS